MIVFEQLAGVFESHTSDVNALVTVERLPETGTALTKAECTKGP